jgi:hypothetical protein
MTMVSSGTLISRWNSLCIPNSNEITDVRRRERKRGQILHWRLLILPLVLGNQKRLGAQAEFPFKALYGSLEVFFPSKS